VIIQKAKLIEMTNEYRILGSESEDAGAIRQEGQSKSEKVFRSHRPGSVPDPLPFRLRGDETMLLEIERPASGSTTRGSVLRLSRRIGASTLCMVTAHRV
jgi:hypothetical protein